MIPVPARPFEAIVDQLDSLTSFEIVEATGISYRQLDYLCREGWLNGYGGETAKGSGTKRRFSPWIVPGLILSKKLRVAFGWRFGGSLRITRDLIEVTKRGDASVEYEGITLSWNAEELEREAIRGVVRVARRQELKREAGQ